MTARLITAFDVYDTARSFPTQSGRRKVGVIGDSIGADAVSYSSTVKQWTNWAWIAWMRRYCGPRIDLPMERVYATGGALLSDVYNATTGIVGTQLTQALTDKLDICIIHIGTNSIGSETSANMITEYTQVFTRLRNNGTFCIIMPIRVHNAPQAFAGTNLLQFSYLNNWIEEYARTQSGMLYLDVNQIYMDFSTGNAQAIYLRDGIHDNQRSAQMMGKYVASVINSLVVDTTSRFLHLGDVYNATNNPTGNKIPNGLLAGTGGALQNGATGTPPTSLNGRRAANSGTVNVAFSKTPNINFVGLEKAVVTLTGTGDGNQGSIVDTGNTNFVVGESIYAECEVDYNLQSSNIVGVGLVVFCYTAGFALLAETWDGYYTLGNGLLAPGTESFMLRTDPIVVPSGTTQLETYMFVVTNTSGTLNDVVNFGRFSLRKV